MKIKCNTKEFAKLVLSCTRIDNCVQCALEPFCPHTSTPNEESDYDMIECLHQMCEISET